MNRPPFCRQCSRPMDSAETPLCSECEGKTLYFDQVWAACQYRPPLDKLMYLFKYGQKTGLRRDFASLINSFTKTYNININKYNIVMPVPLHATRLRERGYNQAGLIARLIADQYGLVYDEGSLIRIRPTPNQARLNKKERWTNIRGAFKMKPSLKLDQKSILLIDDLMTTGATLSEAARVLKQAGAKKVTGLTFAIAPHVQKHKVGNNSTSAGYIQ